MPGDFLDLSSESQPPADDPPRSRRFVGIHFACCGLYSRVYLNRTGTAYEGHCPRCAKRATLKIGPGGTDQRFFTAY